MMVNKLPPNTTFNVLADGTQVGTVTSKKNGQAMVRDRDLSGVDFSTLQDVSLVLASDATEAAHAHF
jgi:hypothetical protein